jgi:hypothetical protein
LFLSPSEGAVDTGGPFAVMSANCGFDRKGNGDLVYREPVTDLFVGPMK